MSIFKKLFQGAAKPTSGTDAEFAEFKENFHLKPDVLFMDYLQQQKLATLIDWLSPQNSHSEAKAFIRLINDANRQRVKIWDQTGITMNFEGGVPSQPSQECFAELAQILKLSITVYYRESPEGDLLKLIFGS